MPVILRTDLRTSAQKVDSYKNRTTSPASQSKDARR